MSGCFSSLPSFSNVEVFRMTNEPESPEYRYKVTIDQCDVEDRGALALYRGKRYEWLSWYELRQGEPNTIQSQIFWMMYLDLVYRTLVVPRHKADEEPAVAAKSNVLAHFLDQGYVATQILAIRRLLDTRNDVFSLRRLLDDITKHRLLITREIYVCNDGLPYDSESWQSFPHGVDSQLWGIEAPRFANYLSSRTRHEMFDRLSGVSPTTRERFDRIRESVFQELKNWLANSTAEKLILLSHKFFAHAASTDSRGSLQYCGISLADVDNVQRAPVRVERAITDILLFIGVYRDVVPMPPLGLLKGLNSPYTTGDLIQKMEEQWNQLVAERNQWSKGIADDL
jgi:hypothetical protein